MLRQFECGPELAARIVTESAERDAEFTGRRRLAAAMGGEGECGGAGGDVTKKLAT